MGRKKYIQAEWMKWTRKKTHIQADRTKCKGKKSWIKGRHCAWWRKLMENTWRMCSVERKFFVPPPLSLFLSVSKKKFYPPMWPSWRKEQLTNNSTDTCETAGLSSHRFTQASYHPHSGFASSRSPWGSLIKSYFSHPQFVLYFPQVHSLFQSVSVRHTMCKNNLFFLYCTCAHGLFWYIEYK